MKNLIIKIFNKLYYIVCKLYNSQYYKYDTISNKVKFTPEFPGFVIFLNPKNIIISDYTVINRNSHINAGNAKVEIGKYCHFGQGLTIYAFNHNYESTVKIPYDEKMIPKNVIIKDFVWIGANVTIVPGVTIGQGVVVAAGSVITKDVPDFAVVGGNRAKVIKYRNKENFLKLYNDNSFF